MLYRRHLRIKVLQSLYSYYTGGTEDIVAGEKQLLKSIDTLHDLFILQLSFLVEVKRFAEIRIEENKHKFYPTEEDLNPNLKFINNKVLNELEHNNEFILRENRSKTNWTEQGDLILRFYNMVRSQDFYKSYMESDDISLDSDKKFLVKTIERCLSEYDLLKAHYEELSVYYTDGYDLVTLLLIKFCDTFSSSFNSATSLPGIYKPAVNGKNEDREFVRKLYKTVIRMNGRSMQSSPIHILHHTFTDIVSIVGQGIM